MRLYVSCALGMEKALGQELRHGNFQSLAHGPGFQETSGGSREALFLLRTLRCAERVFLVLAEFEARDFDQLYDGVYRIPWEDYLHQDQGLVVEKVRLHQSRITSVPHIQSMTQKAAFSRLCRSYGLRSVDLSGYCHQVRVLAHGETVRILLDLSGDALHLRGWRTKSGVAPLKETIAAGMILSAAWKRKYPLWDAFCGSGTLALEALSFAWDLPVHPQRKFALHRLRIHENRSDQLLKDELRSGIATTARVRIHASDIDAGMVSLARENLERFLALQGLDSELAGQIRQSVSFGTGHATRLRHLAGMDPAASGEPGLVVANPPYGERLGDEPEVRRLYREFRDLREHFPAWALSVITTWDDLDHVMETHAEWVKEVRNGSSAAWLYLFQSFAEQKPGKA